MKFVIISDLNNSHGDDGVEIVPFKSGLQALDFAVEVARVKLPVTYKQASSDEEDIYDRLTRFNELAEGRLSIKVVSGFNSKSFVLRGLQDPSDLDYTETMNVCPQDER